MSESVNAFQVKRAAHAVSRRQTNTGWNLFRHLSWRSKDGRRKTWDVGNQLEAQHGVVDDDDEEMGSPIEHSQTAPGGSASRGFSDEDNARTSKDVEGYPSQQTDSSGDTFAPSQNSVIGAAGLEDGVRQRKSDGIKDAEDTTTQDEDDKNKKPKKEHRMFKSVQPKEPFTVGNQLQRTLLNSWINILLLAAPVGIALGYIPGMNKIAVFVVNFMAIIPLAAMLSFATEEIAIRVGETLGGLLNASFGNAVELIVAIIALVDRKVVIVQTSLIGSILSNLLLVMGMCFFFGGLRRQEQFFNITVAQTAASLLALAIAGIIIPTIFDENTTTQQADQAKTAALSRGTAVILLFVYCCYLYFQLKTHHMVFSEESQKVPMRPHKNALKEGAIKQGLVNPVGVMGAHGFSGNAESVGNNEKLSKMLNANPDFEEEEEGEDPQLSFPVAIATLAGSTVIIAFCAELMVDSIDTLTATGAISEEFIGLILLPIVGNAAEHATAVTVAIKDKMDLAIGVAVGSSMQVALFLIPLLVIIGWIMGIDEMDLSFDLFQVAVLFVSILLVNYLIGDGKSHWLEGMCLMCLYLIIAVCSWWYPEADPTTSSG